MKTARYALVALDANQPDPPQTLAVGPLESVTALIPSSIAQAELRADTAAMLAFARDAVGEVKRQAVKLGSLKAVQRLDVINDMAARMDSLSVRLDAHVAKQQLRRQKKREDALRAELDAALAALSGEPPEPNQDPDLEAPNEEPEEYSRHGYDTADDAPILDPNLYTGISKDPGKPDAGKAHVP
jgi:hypothetical protein